jgi:large subunit ribosomal protein L5
MAETPYVPRFKARYRDELVAALKDELGFTNVMQVPRVEKIVVNMGVVTPSGRPYAGCGPRGI